MNARIEELEADLADAKEAMEKDGNRPKTRPQKSLRDGSQNSQILWHLSAGEKLTSLKALNLIEPPCFRLASRICELRRRGHDIKTKTVESIGGAEIAEYWMEA